MAHGLTTRDLRLICAIADERSIAGAARRLSYSQPTASQHLAAIEARMGAQLVERGPRGARLTELGRLAHSHAVEVLDRLTLADAELRLQIEHGLATLRLGMFSTSGSELVPRAIAALESSGIRVDVLEADIPALLEALARREVHAALVYQRPDQPQPSVEGVRFEHLLDDDHLAVLPAGHPAASAPSITLADLSRERWIAAPSDDDPSFTTLLRACQIQGFVPDFAYRVDSFAVTQGFVAAGLGVSLLPRLGLALVRDDVVVRPLAATRVVREVYVGYVTSLPPILRNRLTAALNVEAVALSRAGEPEQAWPDAS
jgi:DNA-binding transcriptional LysR family regulator